MKRRHYVLAAIAAILTVAVLTLIIPVFSGRESSSAFASECIATPTDLEMPPAWTGVISPGDSQVHVLDVDQFGLLTLSPTVSGIYTFSVPSGATSGEGLVNITLYDDAGNTKILYDSIENALDGNSFFGDSANFFNDAQPMVILEHGETIRIAVRINWSMTYNEPANNQNFTISLSCMPTEGTCGENLAWNVNMDTQTLNISGTGYMENYASLGDAPWNIFKDEDVIKHVVIEGATSIGDRAFAQIGVTDVVIPNSVQSIGRSVFNSTGLKQITILSNVTYIDEHAFDGAYGLNVNCEAYSAAYNLAIDKKNAPEKITVTLIPFANTLIIPEDTVSIESKAFANLGEHVNIQIPAGTTNIASDAFDDSTVLLLVTPGSYAQAWAHVHSIPCLPIE